MFEPTLRQLRYAVAVADHRHFGHAAEACHVSQPALSAQVRQLEAGLGVVLFERGNRRVLLTPAGETFVRRARYVLASVDDLVAATTAHREPLQGTLRLGVIPTIAPYLLPKLLPAVRAACPQLQLVLREDFTHRLLAELDAGRLDVALLALPVEADVEVMPLYDEPFLLAAPDGHRLARRTAAHQKDLDGAEVLLLDDGHCLREQALDVCRLAGAHEAAELRATSLGTLVQMVANNLGTTLLPASAAPDAPAGVVTRPFVKPPPSRRVGLVWRRSSPRSGELRLLGRVVLDNLDEVAPWALPLELLKARDGDAPRRRRA